MIATLQTLHHGPTIAASLPSELRRHLHQWHILPAKLLPVFRTSEAQVPNAATGQTKICLALVALNVGVL
jgi:hypothetical protein